MELSCSGWDRYGIFGLVADKINGTLVHLVGRDKYGISGIVADYIAFLPRLWSQQRLAYLCYIEGKDACNVTCCTQI